VSWPTIKLGEVITQLRGVTYSSGDAIDAPKEGYVELLRANNINDGEINFNNVIYVPKSKVSDKQYLKKNDILIAASSGSINLVGKAGAMTETRQCSFGAFCKVIRPSNKIDARYIANFFQTAYYRKKIASLAEGANINNLRNEHIDNLLIPLPSLAEQQRIAAILDKAELIKRKRELAIEKLDSLAESIFLETSKESKNSLEVPLDEVVVGVKNCNPASLFGKSSFTYIDIGAVNNLSKAIVSPQVINGIDAPSRARQIILDGDVLVSTVRPNLNCVALVDEDYINPVGSTGFCVLRCNHEKILPEFLFLLVRSQKFIQNLVNQATGASYPAVSDKIIKSSKVNLPSIGLQKEFAKKVKKISQQKYNLIAQNTELNKLLDSLQSQAFFRKL
jgi:type I restriction enzyme, S subunit